MQLEIAHFKPYFPEQRNEVGTLRHISYERVAPVFPAKHNSDLDALLINLLLFVEVAQDWFAADFGGDDFPECWPHGFPLTSSVNFGADAHFLEEQIVALKLQFLKELIAELVDEVVTALKISYTHVAMLSRGTKKSASRVTVRFRLSN